MNIEKTVKMQVEQNTYEIKFPKTGEILDIDSRKSLLANGQYSYLRLFNRDLVDAISIFSILCPKMKETLNISSILDLDILKSKKLVFAYRRDVKKWYNGIIDFLSEEEDTKDGK